MEEQWARGGDHEKGLLDELRGVQATRLGFTMTPIASPPIDVNMEAFAFIQEVPIAHNSRSEERCEDGGFMKQIVKDVLSRRQGTQCIGKRKT